MGFYLKVTAFSEKTRWAFTKLLVDLVKNRVGLCYWNNWNTSGESLKQMYFDSINFKVWDFVSIQRIQQLLITH